MLILQSHPDGNAAGDSGDKGVANNTRYGVGSCLLSKGNPKEGESPGRSKKEGMPIASRTCQAVVGAMLRLYASEKCYKSKTENACLGAAFSRFHSYYSFFDLPLRLTIVILNFARC